MPPTIRLRGATEHNLKEVDLDLEQGQWIAVVGPSGSGKTSLVFDTLVREGQHRYLSSLSTRARHFFGKLGRAATKELTGLPACIAIGQRTLSPNVRSTVGTMTGTLDLLRLLYARVARDPENEALTRSHFSFNHPLGACATCSGIGIEDFVDPATLVADPSKSLRAGALVPTLKNGYTVYSQVTLEVMNTICAAHGFDVDTPWEALDDDQRKVILYGTRALKVPFGKHPIESRMKWEGITARPREEGYYPGLVPIIEETLKRNRNPNILRFVRSVLCSDCGGSRLARAGREARVGQHSLPQLLAVPVDELPLALESLPSSSVLQVLQPELQARLERMRRLDLGHLALDRESTTLSGGEGQRVLLATQLSAGLCGVMFAMDEPTLGLHPGSQAGMRAVLDDLRELGNTLLVVEHDPDMARHADQMVCIGPGPGTDGGEVTSVGALPENPLGPAPQPKRIRRASGSTVALRGAVLHNLQGDDFTLHLGALNLVIGASGAGKSSLIFGTLLPALTGTTGGPFHNIEGVPLNSVRALDARPIGRTSRSTPATWSGLFDLVRKRFAATEQARARKFGPGHFSYNNKSGRCPTCAGIGTTRLGLHVFENVDVVCEDCRGSRYEAGILEVQLNGRSIADILGMTVREALSFFASDPPIASLCCAMEELGLGHVPLGQPSNQLSRGESQRVKLATLLGTTDAKPTLLFLDEPDRGLHPNDVKLLLAAMERLVEAGHTVLAISHHRHLWAAADFVTEVANGRVRANPELDWSPLTENRKPRQPALTPEFIELKGVSTNNLQGIDVRIPRGQLTGICGVSGSGKSSLAYGTLAAEAWQRFSESLPFEVRRHMRRMPRPELESASGLGPTLSLLQGDSFGGTRSSVATQTGLGPVLRLLFSRAGMLDGEPCDLTAEHFSSDRALGACQVCKGRGSVPRCSEARLISDPSLSLLEGAMAGTKPGAYFSERDGQYIATLRTALGPAVDLTLPWQDLPEQARQQALNGSGSKSFKVAWTLAEGSQEESSTHHFEGTWDGFLSLVERESERRANQKSASAWSEPLQDGPCSTCDGSGLGSRSRRVVLGDWTLPGLMQVPLGAVLVALRSLKQGEGLGLRALQRAAIERLLPEVSERLEDLAKLGLGHIPLGRRTSELSGGERQRVRLVSVLRSGLSGVTLVLDEPSAGLQGDEVEALIERLRCLQQANNTIVVVEHDQGFLREMDHLIELGPGAGEQGGTIVAQGAPAEVLVEDRWPGQTLVEAPPVPPVRCAQRLRLSNISAGPLRMAKLDLPLSGWVDINGPSGSGKSTLLFDVLQASFDAGLPVGCEAIDLEGNMLHFRKVVGAQRPQRNGTVIGALDLMKPMQQLFHGQSSEVDLPLQAFSFLSPKGRCNSCNGSGQERISMDFMADLDLPCPTCGGKRYRSEVLTVQWEGLDAAQFLEQQATPLMALLPSGKLKRAIAALEQVGLGYLTLGRGLKTLSGGEVQRLALARGLASTDHPSLFLFDHPDAGLHNSNLEQIVKAFKDLSTRGNLVVTTARSLVLHKAANVGLTL